MNSEVSTLKEVLKRNEFSMTNARQQVFKAFLDSDTLSMNQLVRKLQHKIDRTSVYRTVELFEKLGIINRIQIGWKYKLELSDLFTEHHHHATCMQCGKIIAFEESTELENHILSQARQLGFVPTSHSLELRGICAECQQKSTPKLVFRYLA